MAPPLDLRFDLPAITIRLCWALLLGSAIGFERQWHQKMAGLKTNALVCVGAAGFVCFAAVAGQGNPSVVSAQIVTGIGFLGAGVIMREGLNVHGLNTAATLWCSAMVGTLCGFGLWQAAGVAASIVLGANLGLRPVANALNDRVQAGNEVESRYTLTLTASPSDAARLRQSLLRQIGRPGLTLQRLRSEMKKTGQVEITLVASASHALDETVEALLAGFALDPAVTNTAWEVDRATPEA